METGWENPSFDSGFHIPDFLWLCDKAWNWHRLSTWQKWYDPPLDWTWRGCCFQRQTTPIAHFCKPRQELCHLDAKLCNWPSLRYFQSTKSTTKAETQNVHSHNARLLENICTFCQFNLKRLTSLVSLTTAKMSILGDHNNWVIARSKFRSPNCLIDIVLIFNLTHQISKIIFIF